MKTFELLQQRPDGSLSSVTFVKADSEEEAKVLTAKCWCTGAKVIKEVIPKWELF